MQWGDYTIVTFPTEIEHCKFWRLRSIRRDKRGFKRVSPILSAMGVGSRGFLHVYCLGSYNIISSFLDLKMAHKILSTDHKKTIAIML